MRVGDPCVENTGVVRQVLEIRNLPDLVLPIRLSPSRVSPEHGENTPAGVKRGREDGQSKGLPSVDRKQ